MNTTLSKLSIHLFWDVDFSSLDENKHSRFIIERVVSKGNINDWQAIKEIYGLQKIKNEIIEIRYIDNKTFSFLSSYFNIDKSKFRCYN